MKQLAKPVLRKGDSPLKGKHLFAIGYSHVEMKKSSTFLTHLEDLVGCKYHQILRKVVGDRTEFYIDDKPTGIIPNCDGFNWAQYVDVISKYCEGYNMPFDYLFIENCHFR